MVWAQQLVTIVKYLSATPLSPGFSVAAVVTNGAICLRKPGREPARFVDFWLVIFFLPDFSHPFLWHRLAALLPLHNESSFGSIRSSGRDRFAAATCPLQPLILALKPSCYFIHPACLSVAVPVAPLQHITTSVWRDIEFAFSPSEQLMLVKSQPELKNHCPKTTVSFCNPFPREH